MRARSSASSTRRPALVLIVACAALSGCFALFSLDGYGPPPDEATLDGGAPDGLVGGPDAADARSDAAPGRTIFVTGETWNGNLGARDGGDTKCQAIATDAGLAGSYRVWLSDVSGDAVDHLVRDAGPLRLRSGAIVAADVDELVDSGPRVAIAIDERGRAVSGGGCSDGGLAAWTDTSANGIAAGSLDCSIWSSANPVNQGVVGLVGERGSAWTAACQQACDRPAALYCIQQ